MDTILRLPLTAAVFAAMAVLLSGCIAYDAASTVASVGGAVVRTGAAAVSTTADIATTPFDRQDKTSK